MFLFDMYFSFVDRMDFVFMNCGLSVFWAVSFRTKALLSKLRRGQGKLSKLPDLLLSPTFNVELFHCSSCGGNFALVIAVLRKCSRQGML